MPEPRSASIPPAPAPSPVRRSCRRRRRLVSTCVLILYPDRAVKPPGGEARDRSLESPFRGWPVLSGCREILERESALRSLEIEALDRGGGSRILPVERRIRKPSGWTGPSAYRGRRRLSAQGGWLSEHGFCLNAPVHSGHGRGGRISERVQRGSVQVREAPDAGRRAPVGGFGLPWPGRLVLLRARPEPSLPMFPERRRKFRLHVP
jgi:hypothetical protein